MKPWCVQPIELDNMIRNTAIVLFCLFLFSACFNKADKADIVALNTLQDQLDSAKQVFASIDLNKVQEVQQEITDHIAFVKQYDEYFSKDTVFVKYYGLYSGTGKSISRLMRGDFMKYASKIEYCNQQIAALSKDLKKGLIPNDSIPFYMHNEEKAAKNVMQNIYKTEYALNLHMESYAYSKNAVDSIINEVKKRKALE